MNCVKLEGRRSQPVADDAAHQAACQELHYKYFLEVTYDRYRLPIMIVENGLEAKDVVEEDGSIHDDDRMEYMRTHLKECLTAIGNGVEVQGQA